MNLEALASKYGTDKLEHGYIPFYEQHLPKAPKRILEIGVKEGRSLAMWAEYFPEAEIHGLDLFSELDENGVFANINRLGGNIGKIALHRGNQCDWRLLEQLRKYDFDIIIDDGSHNSRDQLMTFFGLFNGKHYFIEDLHCNYEEFYSQGIPEEYRPLFLFRDLIFANSSTVYEGDIVFEETGMGDDKIVCIKNIH